MKVIFAESRQSAKQSTNQLGNRRCSSANGFFTSKIVGAVTSLIFMLALGLTGIGGFGVSNVSAKYGVITMNVASSIAIDVLPTANGTFVTSDTTSDTISITTDNSTGYTLSIMATNKDDALVNTSDSTKTIPSITNAVSEADYSNDNNATTYNDTWGYRPSKLNSANNSDYLPAPIDDTTVLETTSSANTVANTYNIAIGARITSSTTPGSYDNTFVITAIANPTPYTITYNANTTDAVSDLPSSENSSTYSDTVSISSTTPTRTGYDFTGWCTVQVADGAACTSTTYTAGSAWNIDQTVSSNSLTLYAMWEQLPINLYDAVAAAWAAEGSRVMTNDDDADTGIQAEITADNSGVFKYDPYTFGASSDAANTSDIYFYRGILDSNLDGTSSTYGSAGDGVTHPNYVILDADGTKDTSDTCWRIVRTTGSGGVKMIYNGKWTGSTCANATTDAQLATLPFNDASATVDDTTYTGLQYQNMHAVGYTYSNVPAGTTSATALSTLLGASGNDTTTNTNNSIIKQYIENWYSANMRPYTSTLESNAGYCNDRTVYPYGSYAATDRLAESTTVIPYTQFFAGVQYFFGPQTRNVSGALPPSLNCPRGIVDLYSTTTASGGNGQLAHPVALLTADEIYFAGLGGDTAVPYSHGYNYSNFLRSGSPFRLLSPSVRDYTHAGVFAIDSDGLFVNNTGGVGVRPVVSLVSGTTANSGSGTAADPWVVMLLKTKITVVAGDNVTSVSINGGTAGVTVSDDFYESEEITITATTDNYLQSWSNSTSNGTMTKTGTKTISYKVGSAPTTITATATTNPTYIHNFTASSCNSNASSNDKIYNVYDQRDGKDYSVRYINGECWMTQNLRFTGRSINSAYTNINTSKSLNYYQLDTKGTSGGQCSQGTSSTPLGYTNLCIKDSGSETTGVWYNYAAASAGTITGYSNSTADTYSLCPRNWKLPTAPNTTAGTDFNKLVGNTISGSQDATAGLMAFDAVAGGRYSSGSLNVTGFGYWWSATSSSGSSRLYLNYSSSSNRFNGGGVSRYEGLFIRCVRSS